MPRDYKNIKKSTPKKESKLGGILCFLSGLSLGLLIATIVFFYGDDIARQLQVQRNISVNKDSTDFNGDETPAEAIPEPIFEFYNILPNKEVDISALVTRDAEKENRKDLEEEGNYILQVGSFKKYSAADQVKARLALLGFQAYIESGVINGEGTYRVRIGPYKTRTKLRQARERLLANNLDFIQMRL
jgi:cell division protein FtsN